MASAYKAGDLVTVPVGPTRRQELALVVDVSTSKKLTPPSKEVSWVGIQLVTGEDDGVSPWTQYVPSKNLVMISTS